MISKLRITTYLLGGGILFSSPLEAASRPEMSAYGKVLSGVGVTVEMASFKEKNDDGMSDVLLKISGNSAYDEGIDGQVLRYSAVPSGTGVNYQFKGGKGESFVRMASRGESTEVYFGDQTVPVKLNKEKVSFPEHLLTAYLKPQEAKALERINPYGLAFEGDGVFVEMATFLNKNATNRVVLLKMSGELAEADGIDKIVLKYEVEPAGTGVNFQSKMDGKTAVLMKSRAGWGRWDQCEVYLNGKTISVSPTDKVQVFPLHLLTEFEAQKKR